MLARMLATLALLSTTNCALVWMAAAPDDGEGGAGGSALILPDNCRRSTATCDDDWYSVDCDVVSGGTQPDGCKLREPSGHISLLCCPAPN